MTQAEGCVDGLDGLPETDPEINGHAAHSAFALQTKCAWTLKEIFFIAGYENLMEMVPLPNCLDSTVRWQRARPLPAKL